MRQLVVTLLSLASTLEAQMPSTRDRVEALLSRMTLEEKVGQMTQVTVSVVATDSQPQRDRIRLDSAKLREAVVRRGVGSILNNIEGAIPAASWQMLVRQIQDVATKETRLRIPVLYGADAVHGHNYATEGTIFPHNISLAATFNKVLAEQVGEVTGREMLASGLPWNFAPVLDVGRHAAWPRFYETLGEDAYLAGVLGAAQVRGIQSTGKVAATMKHYLGYGLPRMGRDRTPSDVSARYVREHALPSFRAAIAAGARSVMVNSGEIDGEPVHASKYWLTDVLRTELGFTGVVVTDWEDINFLHTRHHVAPTLKDAVRIAIEAGVDMSMTPLDYRFADDLVALVKEGAIPMRRVDQSVRRILTMKLELGLFDDPYPDPTLASSIGTSLSRTLARQAAREGITLLQNRCGPAPDGRPAPSCGVLPLGPDLRVLVTGPAATSVSALHGGWSYTWQGTNAAYYPPGSRTLLGTIRSRAPAAQYVEGAQFNAPTDNGIAEAVRAARQSDVAIIALGEEGYAEWVGDIADLTLADAQLELAKAVIATGTPTILVLVEGRPRIIRPLVDSARAIIFAGWPGMEGAEAIAEILFGEVSPSGRLPFSYPRATNALVTYDRKPTETLTGWGRDSLGFAPEFEFGHGLSYTTFTYSGLAFSRQRLAAGEKQVVRVTVTNSGARAGEEAVLLFTRQHYAALTPSVRKLRAFEKVALAPGQSRELTFSLGVEDLGYVGKDGRIVVDPGMFDVMIGGLKETFAVDVAARTANGAP